jgi:hypothetical protein
MAIEIPSGGAPLSGELLHHEDEPGYVYDDWSLTAKSRAKMVARWPTLDLACVDLAAKEFASAWASKGSNIDGFVGWREISKRVVCVCEAAEGSKRLRLRPAYLWRD